MAEALLRRGMGKDGAVIVSAGIAALVGHQADPLARSVMRDHGIDIDRHRAQQATAGLLFSSDLILALDQSQRQWIDARFPQLRGRVHKLGKWTGDADVVDPYQGPVSGFERAYDTMDAAVVQWLRRL